MNPADPETEQRLDRQLRFALELDRLKGVLRRTQLLHVDRRENSAEHSWHIAVLACMVAEHCLEPVEVGRTVEMLLLHDVVEIDAGDTFCYDAVGNADKAEREEKAADRIFGLLPPDQATRYRQLWEEFEARATPEARFANAVDRLMPVLHNLETEGRAWREHGVTAEQVLRRNAVIGESLPAAWATVRRRIEEAVKAGWLPAAPDGSGG